MRLLAQFVGVLLLVGFVGAYFWWIAAASLVVAGFYGLRCAYRQRAGLAAERSRIAGLIARADEQHRQVMRGDDRGMYGQYPPVPV